MKVTIELENERDELQYLLDGRTWASVVEALFKWAELQDYAVSGHEIRAKIEELLKKKRLSTFG